jgi:hypothetical protein
MQHGRPHDHQEIDGAMIVGDAGFQRVRPCRQDRRQRSKLIDEARCQRFGARPAKRLQQRF